MIALGTDLLEIARVERIWRRHPERFARRVLTPGELEHYGKAAQPWRYLAKRFAAKEAIAKALGCGIGIRLSWQDMEISNAASGAPWVALSGPALAIAREQGGTRVLLSISDEQHYAVAFAALVA